MTYIWIPIIVIAGIFWIAKLVNKMLAKVPEDPRTPVKFYDGPLHEMTELIPDPQAFYIAPYLPREEQTQGYPVRFALYQQAMDDSYFYRRDLTDDEMQRLTVSGKLPPEFAG